MVIGNPNWFDRRKYGGWGLTPKTWQGWTYIAIFAIPFTIFQAIPVWSIKLRIIVTAVWFAILLIDIFDIMRKLKIDEREKIHEAIAERNALWAIISVIVIGILYETTKGALEQKFYTNPFLIAALFAGVIVKSISNIYLDKKN